MNKEKRLYTATQNADHVMLAITKENKEDWPDTFLIDGQKIDKTVEPFMILNLKCCERLVVYKTFAAFPREDTPCPCGKTNSWLVKYV